MGDDTTDEDMFRALPVSAITVKVGIVSEKAKYNLSSQEEVLPFLEKLSGEGVSYGTTSKSIKGQLKATVDFLKDCGQIKNNFYGQVKLRSNRKLLHCGFDFG